jgi:hypothetical protein
MQLSPWREIEYAGAFCSSKPSLLEIEYAGTFWFFQTIVAFKPSNPRCFQTILLPYPEAAAKVRAECRKTLSAEKLKAGDVSLETAMEMKYTEAAVMEALRVVGLYTLNAVYP